MWAILILKEIIFQFIRIGMKHIDAVFFDMQVSDKTIIPF